MTSTIRPGDPSHEAHLAVDRRIEAALRPHGHLPGVQNHRRIVARIQRELTERGQRAAAQQSAASEAAAD